MEYKNLSLKEACDFVIFSKNKEVKGDIGVIGIDTEGRVAMVFNCERMHRGYKAHGKKTVVKIYK
jgi:L-asparaginase / beta-aspartyl-peptidase